MRQNNSEENPLLFSNRSLSSSNKNINNIDTVKILTQNNLKSSNSNISTMMIANGGHKASLATDNEMLNVNNSIYFHFIFTLLTEKIFNLQKNFSIFNDATTNLYSNTGINGSQGR